MSGPVLNLATRLARLVLRALNAAVRLPVLTLRTGCANGARPAYSRSRVGISDSSDDDRRAGIAWGALAPA